MAAMLRLSTGRIAIRSGSLAVVIGLDSSAIAAKILPKFDRVLVVIRRPQCRAMAAAATVLGRGCGCGCGEEAITVHSHLLCVIGRLCASGTDSGSVVAHGYVA